MATPNFKITDHPLSNPQTSPALLAKTLHHLRQPAILATPNGLALYRRLQFGRFLESSYLYTNRDLATQTTPTADEGEDSEPWFYAFVDRGCRPETEVWFLGSWEISGSLDGDEAVVLQHGVESEEKQRNQQKHEHDNDNDDDEAIQTLLLSFIRSIKSHDLPPSIHKPEDVLLARSQIAGGKKSNPHPHSANHNATTPNDENDHDPNNPLSNTQILLFGAISARTTHHLQRLNLLATHLLPLIPNHTFLFPLASLPKPPSTLPPTLRWGKLQPQHFPLVRSRTEIARQDFTLARLPGLGIFPAEPQDAAPVAWAFVGLDGSLTTLHTEASHRRMGLGRLLTGKLFGEEMGRFWEEGVERVAHGNVMVGNEASAKMCMSLGGRDIGEVYWLRVDLERC